ncbi:polyprenyl synthetase family protein [Chondromyces crocatus]|nr:polyprenyl synthetase family protein [Chondromyces crocatus]
MPLSKPAAAPLDLRGIRQAVEATLHRFLDHKAHGPHGPHLTPLLQVLRHFLEGGGKRVRPLYCCLGWHTVTDAAPSDEVLRAAAGLELFHTFALLHDDVIDASPTRHGRPTAHRMFATQSRTLRALWFGDSAAILLGDLCEAWSAELLGSLGHPAARKPVDLMRSEMTIGQYLDLCAAGGVIGSLDDALTVIHYKTTKYTVERPLQIGAALASASPAVMEACSAYARPLGEAFQLYDDLEDVLPTSAHAASSGNDLREGKHTVVLALAYRHASPAQAAQLDDLVGDAYLDGERLARARALIDATGATEIVRRMVMERRRQALHAVERAPFRPAAKQALIQLTELALPGVSAWEATASGN